jgi:aerobic-type carbon monoxide dehydrogenase small subunit (CoxS/CutS family)
MIETIEFRLNGEPVKIDVDGERMLLWVLRHDLGLTGTKYGCGKAYCGACTVIIGGKPQRSCRIPVRNVSGTEVLTIEGLAPGGKLHPLQEAFVAEGALQCGYCTPGMILTAYSLLLENPEPTEAEIIEGMDGNLCRCGAHGRIVRAIAGAARSMKGGKP